MEKGQAMLAKLGKMSGAEFDATYMKESGVKGHQTLDKVIDHMCAKAERPDLEAPEGGRASHHPLALGSGTR